ncbi:hypothetical protein PFICI_04888 [Pestalotiopsis fici W106-1]|uniref:Protein kinase domain-containing protein n=1 Tax=Pestalotiopsis fici (strain W106-1 / CGMCC3.15140) TaxID=1229662 RepID=W3XC40_PESFW|nr:uncharacterized protein PFICI_04888 [Pestalotiopsis fici W106-1]ETS83012.1 hypothetical protein PFICI_04888 [Pestalotiopsis fici W106-1]
MNQDRCLIFPWPNGGNLKNYWEKFQDKRSDRESLQWILGQFKGLFSALQELHESNCRHGDLEPENILWFQDEHNHGTLQITDIGLAKLHEKEKSIKARQSWKSFKTVAPWLIMSRYEPPEMNSTREDPGARSRQYDMWSMGCVTLELLIWIVYGYDAVKTFIKSTDYFWTAGPVDAPPSPYRVHPYVVSCMRVMMTQLDDQSALKDLLGLVEKTPGC